MVKDYFLLAYRSARQRKLRSILTMIGIFIGIAAVVALISLSQGLKNAVAEQFVKLGSDKLIVQAAGGGFGPPGTGVSVYLTKKDKEVIEKTSGVDIVVGRLIRTIKIEQDDEQRFTYGVSFPEDKEEQKLVIESNDYQIEQGNLLESNSKTILVIGHNLQTDFFNRDLALRNKVMIQSKIFEIGGILKKSGNPQKDNNILLPEKAMRDILNVPEDYDIIAVKVKAGEDPTFVMENIKKELRRAHNLKEGKEDFTVQSPQQLISSLNTILIIIEGVLVGIAAIALIIGGIGIMNTMYTSVLERTREVGILKSLGATNQNILLLFLVESGLLGLLGGVIGIILGFSISKTVEFIAYQAYESPLIQANISLSLIFGALLFSFIIGALSGTLPARQAAQLKPVDALRK